MSTITMPRGRELMFPLGRSGGNVSTEIQFPVEKSAAPTTRFRSTYRSQKIAINTGSEMEEQSAPRVPYYMTKVVSDTEKLWERQLTALLELQKIGPDWDGEDALAPAPELIESVALLFNSAKFRRMMGPPEFVFPLPTGGIAFDWHDGDSHLTFSVESPYAGRYIQMNPNKPTVFISWSWTPDFDQT